MATDTKPEYWLIDTEGTCDGCAEHKQLILGCTFGDSEPWLCRDCALLQPEAERLDYVVTCVTGHHNFVDGYPFASPEDAARAAAESNIRWLDCSPHRVQVRLISYGVWLDA